MSGAGGAGTGAVPPALTVLVSPACPGCPRALALVAGFRAERPDVRVDVIDVTRDDARLPPGFAGTPMFYVGATVLSYGNPTQARLRQAFAATPDGAEGEA